MQIQRFFCSLYAYLKISLQCKRIERLATTIQTKSLTRQLLGTLCQTLKRDVELSLSPKGMFYHQNTSTHSAAM